MPSTAEAPAGPPLARSKLVPPIRRASLPRRALLATLAGAPPRRLTVVRAPAGWGKTTLLAAWARDEREPRRVAWLSLDAGDSPPTRFWSSVVAALQTVDPGIGAGALPLLAAPGVDVASEVVPRLLDDLSGRADAIILVLDDLHLVSTPSVHAALGRFVELAPANLEVAIGTRSAPALPLGRLRASADLREIDERVLAFDLAEATSLLNGIAGLHLAPAAVSALTDRTEGWAAGLVLAALSLRGRRDAAAFVSAFAGDDRRVVDYLAGEVLAGVREELRSFLLRTSILDRLTAAACEAVTGSREASRLLEEAERSSLFVVALDDRRREYRYHHLFAELLRSELERTVHELVPELHRRAARHFLAEGDPDGAIRHLTLAGDNAGAAQLVAEHWTGWLLGRGEHDVIDGWLAGLADGLVRATPQLCVAMVIVRQSLGRIAAAEAWATAGEAALRHGGTARDRSDVAGARAAQEVIAGRVGAALAAADHAIAVADPTSPWATLGYGARAHALRWMGDSARARTAFADGYLREAAARGELLGMASSWSSLAFLHAEEGRFGAAEEVAAAALETARHALGEHWMMMGTHTALALAAAARGDRSASRAHGRRAVELVRRGGVAGERASALLAVAGLALDDGDAPRAAALTAEARELLGRCSDPGALPLERLARAEAAVRTAIDAGGHSARIPEEPLSERELAVLHLLATDRSQREIGQALFVSLNTVKTHSRHIFRKLGASGRADAVDRARAAGLLERRSGS